MPPPDAKPRRDSITLDIQNARIAAGVMGIALLLGGGGWALSQSKDENQPQQNDAPVGVENGGTSDRGSTYDISLACTQAQEYRRQANALRSTAGSVFDPGLRDTADGQEERFREQEQIRSIERLARAAQAACSDASEGD
jgi:hypothetical protein